VSTKGLLCMWWHYPGSFRSPPSVIITRISSCLHNARILHGFFFRTSHFSYVFIYCFSPRHPPPRVLRSGAPCISLSSAMHDTNL
jgi:hypothetical protein